MLKFASFMLFMEKVHTLVFDLVTKFEIWHWSLRLLGNYGCHHHGITFS